MISPFLRRCAGTLLLSSCLLGSALAADNSDSQESFSAANQLLFFEPHLQNIKQPQTIHYRFAKTGSLEAGFEDTFDIAIKQIHSDGSKDAEVSYFSGDRARFVPEIEHADGNPMLPIFLQRDVNEMARMTGGHWRHFQKQIKLALENNAEIHDVTIEYNGEQVAAKAVEIHPYKDDPFKDRFEQYLDKRYVFTLSNAVPGMIYSIKTHVGGDKDALLEETIQFISAK